MHTTWTCFHHRLRIRILWILKVPKIYEFLTNFKTVNFKIHKIQIITFIVAKFQQILCRKHSTQLLDLKCCDVNNNQDSLTRQQFSLLQSLRIAFSFTVFPCVRIAVLDHHCPLFPFNGCLIVIWRIETGSYEPVLKFATRFHKRVPGTVLRLLNLVVTADF